MAASALNALVREIARLEALSVRVRRQRSAAGGVYAPPEPLGRPWEVRLGAADDGAPLALVRPGRVLAGFGTDCCRADIAATGRLEREARWEYPFGGWEAGWQELALDDGADGGGVAVWLYCTGELAQRDVPFTAEDDRCAGWYGEATALPETLEWGLAAGDPPQDCLRCWPLAHVQADAPQGHGVVQLAWGDLCLFDVRGVLDAQGAPLAPALRPAEAWGGDEGLAEVCTLAFSTDAEQVEEPLLAGLDDQGGLEFFAGLAMPETGSAEPGEEEPPPPVPESPGGGFGGGGDAPWEDDDEPDEPGKPPRTEDPEGFFYEAEAPLSVSWRRSSAGGRLACVFNVSCGSLAAFRVSEELRFEGALRASVKANGGSYDWPEGGQAGLVMFYGLESTGGNFLVRWKSSFLGVDDLPKEAQARFVATRTAACTPAIEGNFNADSEHAPSAYAGNILVFTPAGEVTMNGLVTQTDWLTGKPVRLRKRRTFRKFRISLDKAALQRIARNKARAQAPAAAQVSPPSIAGECSNVAPPVVSAAAISAACATAPEGLAEATGPLAVSFAAQYGAGETTVGASGSSTWNLGTESGSISGVFVVALSAEAKDFE